VGADVRNFIAEAWVILRRWRTVRLSATKIDSALMVVAFGHAFDIVKRSGELCRLRWTRVVKKMEESR
jgi:hypothetical protein